MKSVSSVILRVFTAVAAIAAGCTPADKFLRATSPGIEISAEDVADHEILIESSSAWMVDTSRGAEWFNVWYDASDTNLLWARALSRNESLEERTAEIAVVSGDGLALSIPFVQLAMDVRFDVSPRVIEPFGARDDTKRTLTVTSNLTSGWEFSVLHAADWITVARGTEAEGTANIVTVGASHTRSLDERRDTIVLRPLNEAFHARADSVAVVQAGIDLVVYSPQMNEETFVVEVPAEGGEVHLSVYSKAAWRVSPGAPADRVALDITEGGADTENGIPVVVTVAENPAAEEYTFTLIFDSGGETYEYICRQQGNPAEQGAE